METKININAIPDSIPRSEDFKTINGESILGSGDINIKSESVDTSNLATKEELNGKQDAITDLDTIRSGSALGATALQSVPSEYSPILDVLKAVYPVGAIYISTVVTSPQTLFGFGTWEQIEDRFLLAAGDKYLAGSTGGEESHKLTYSELPETNGEIIMHHAAVGTNIANVGGCFTGDSIVQGKYRQGGTLLDADTASIGKINYTNGGQNKAHNNMPPYLTVYMWKRVS